MLDKGNIISTLVPLPYSEVYFISPSWALIISKDNVTPNPVPSFLVRR